MLGKLFGKRKTVKHEADQIWKTRALEFEGLVALIQTLNPATDRALVITQFPDTFRALNDLFLSRSLAFKTYPTAFEGARLRDRSEYQLPGYTLLVPAQALPDNHL